VSLIVSWNQSLEEEEQKEITSNGHKTKSLEDWRRIKSLEEGKRSKSF